MSDDPSTPDPRPLPSRSAAAAIVAIASVLLIGLSLRIPTISLAPLVPTMKVDTGHGETFLSLLTSIPLVLTLLAAPIAPALANRLGRSRTVSLSLVAIVASMALRSVPGDVPLLIGTGLLGFSIAIVTVLVPSIINAERAGIRSRLTGTYSMSLSLGPALALGLTIPIREVTGLNWRGTLLTWALCSVIALTLWLVYVRTPHVAASSGPHRDPAASGTGGDHRAKAVVTDANVWLLALFLGATSLTFYTTSAWLPSVFVMDGMSAQAAGAYTSLISIVAIPFGLIAPIALRGRLSRFIAPLAPVLAVIGLLLLLTLNSAGALPTTILLGVSQGLCLGASYDQIVKFGRSPAHTASVSAVTSAVGVALAAIGPLAFGFGLETAASPVVPVIGLAVIVLAQSSVGFRTSRL
ncbi:MFS transporter, CP family, cyanate transporter [Brevibacterium sandarakinum]|uniref:MFS transporter, CP family, cyanate transporter n=1 Tax=Brevibacterium sandarakinum TaxID=629680 RepID=A0A1H1UL52_BRESA|nr:MFS transporter [Brevibacterium sandarakinum]SDS73248.1 MFS transporter, CP family, cyanate transporter [Brevibacterium sandarakinum]